MAVLVSHILVDIRAMLNDPSGTIYPDVSLLPLLRKVYVELQTKLSALGSSVNKEIGIPIPVTIGTNFLGDGSGLPTDFLLPIQLSERVLGSQDKYKPMTEDTWEPDEKPSDALKAWAWREERIHFVGALTDREVLLKYKKQLTPLTELTTPIQIFNSQTWLAQRTASLASLLIGSNQSRANALQDDLMSQSGPWEDLKQTLMHRMQSIPVRRRRTRWRKR